MNPTARACCKLALGVIATLCCLTFSGCEGEYEAPITSRCCIRHFSFGYFPFHRDKNAARSFFIMPRAASNSPSTLL